MSQNGNKQIDPSLRYFFEDKNLAFVATLMKDGSPQITPTWVDIDNENRILINTALGRIKQKNVTRDPRVAISIVDRNNPYHMITIRGEVIEQITGEQADKHIDKMAKKYLNKDKYPFGTSGEKRVLLKIRPIKVSSI
ncbi:PPOX class F420-dependent oxidoreductase [Candidatus Nitrosocosmicus franklandus]|uniref:Pyridoxamine 5'-phosphate oxidase n=1 Tax=Candidatus Nitrosocosmicus franklandianus TaxID=1798806 RepID=A0A484I6Q6_9ARCH|nr:PPOX class F420-dependent oxidoreductase [Candidatus Nitrosocosmicus franklandus]VFJ13409.1 Pyridoxamine 5'-phosphate oxidase [Candidatus Nitrosocosmicus franklandus]